MSAKNLDRHNRWRSKTVAFRMSPEEADQLDTNVRLSGLTSRTLRRISGSYNATCRSPLD